MPLKVSKLVYICRCPDSVHSLIMYNSYHLQICVNSPAGVWVSSTDMILSCELNDLSEFLTVKRALTWSILHCTLTCMGLYTTLYSNELKWHIVVKF